MLNYGPDLFKGTAEYYAKYRAPYPAELFCDIVQNFGLDGQGKLLDLSCGTGEIAIPLAGYFEKVLAIDPEQQMLDEGHVKARRQGINNINWHKGSSKRPKRLERGL